MSAEGFFGIDGESLVPAAFATSPWGQVLHGRLIGGLTARAAEQARASDPDLTCARLTIDLFKSVPLAPVQVSTRTVRQGRRIAVLDVTVEQDGELAGQGRAVLLRRSEQPAGTFRSVPAWDAAVPQRFEAPPASGNGSSGNRRWNAPWESWRVGGESGLTEGLWMRETHPLITGEELTPLTRVAMAADLASPVSHYSDQGLSFINADYTVYLGREPQGEYVGIEPSGHISDRGVAAGRCVLHDMNGQIGFVSNTAVANPTMGAHR
jgi:hypothetical protein